MRKLISILLVPLRRTLLRIGYRLPKSLQWPFHRFLYDSPRPTGRLIATATEDSGRQVQFEFMGGCRDGQIFCGLAANPFYWESSHGHVGTRFRVASDAAVDAMLRGEPTGPIKKYEYEIVENRTENGVTYVLAKATVRSPDSLD